jgi:hypothetical protein
VTVYTCGVCAEPFEGTPPRDDKPDEAKLLWNEDNAQRVVVVCPDCFILRVELYGWRHAAHLNHTDWVN